MEDGKIKYENKRADTKKRYKEKVIEAEGQLFFSTYLSVQYLLQV